MSSPVYLPTVSAIGTYADLPAFGIQGRKYFATDTNQEWYDTGTAWVNISQPGIFVDELITFSGTSGALSHTPHILIGLFKNGQRLTALGDLPDFSISEAAITLTIAEVSTDVFEAVYWY